MNAFSTGLLGGSFDPVHNAHMAMARLALERLGAGEVHFLPVSRPPHKTDRTLSTGFHRYAMLTLATLDEPRFRVSNEELTRAGRSYTIDTLKRLNRSKGNRRHWLFLAGADAFAEIETWKQAKNLLEHVDFIVFPRQNITFPQLRRRVPPWAAERMIEHSASTLRLPLVRDEHTRVHWVPLEVPAVSSTEVRNHAAAGGDISSLVPEPVARYIDRYGLYDDEGSQER
jgi:nicotinate-nucleotide adenylyltransferase